jgi:hypothetical protein
MWNEVAPMREPGLASATAILKSPAPSALVWNEQHQRAAGEG